MGRGRAKAKQAKVARELKYREFNTDFAELERELHGDSHEDDPYNDPYADEVPFDADESDGADSEAQTRESAPRR